MKAVNRVTFILFFVMMFMPFAFELVFRMIILEPIIWILTGKFESCYLNEMITSRMVLFVQKKLEVDINLWKILI